MLDLKVAIRLEIGERVEQILNRYQEENFLVEQKDDELKCILNLLQQLLVQVQPKINPT
jgi:hypothetical protein